MVAQAAMDWGIAEFILRSLFGAMLGP